MSKVLIVFSDKKIEQYTYDILRNCLGGETGIQTKNVGTCSKIYIFENEKLASEALKYSSDNVQMFLNYEKEPKIFR